MTLATVGYATKRELKSSKGKPLYYTETSMFGPEYKANGRFCVVGHSAYNRKWFASVTMQDGLIHKVI